MEKERRLASSPENMVVSKSDFASSPENTTASRGNFSNGPENMTASKCSKNDSKTYGIRFYGSDVTDIEAQAKELGMKPTTLLQIFIKQKFIRKKRGLDQYG